MFSFSLKRWQSLPSRMSVHGRLTTLRRYPIPRTLREVAVDMSLLETSPESRDNAMQASVRLNTSSNSPRVLSSRRPDQELSCIQIYSSWRSGGPSGCRIFLYPALPESHHGCRAPCLSPMSLSRARRRLRTSAGFNHRVPGLSALRRAHSVEVVTPRTSRFGSFHST